MRIERPFNFIAYVPIDFGAVNEIIPAGKDKCFVVNGDKALYLRAGQDPIRVPECVINIARQIKSGSR